MDFFLEKWNFLLSKDVVNSHGFVRENIENEIVSAIRIKGNIFYFVTHTWSDSERNSLLDKLGLTQTNLESDIIMKYRYFIERNHEFDSFEDFYRYLVASGRNYIYDTYNQNNRNKKGWDYVDIEEEHLEVPEVVPINENEVTNRLLLFRQFKNFNPFCHKLMYNKYYLNKDYTDLLPFFPEVASVEALRQRMTNCKSRFRNFLINPF